MKALLTLIDDLPVEVKGKSAKDVEVKSITDNSKEAGESVIFVAIKGGKVDGAEFIKSVIEKGCNVIVCSAEVKISEKNLKAATFLITENPRKILSLIATKFYKSQPSFIAAVTGTNGKTSVVNFCRQIWAQMGEKTASIGTIGIIDGQGRHYDTEGSMTTPNPLALHKKLSELKKKGIEYVALEASSHGLHQHRLDGVKISAAGFTNLTRDHLDYHGSMRNYLLAKRRLFSDLLDEKGTAVINADSDVYPEIKRAAEKRGLKIISFGEQGKNIRLTKRGITKNGQEIGLSIDGRKYNAEIRLAGEFQVSNLLCAIGLVMASGATANDIISVLPHIKNVPGRMELAGKKENGASVFVDYAHTPDALEKALLTLRPHTAKRLVVIFGCGGDRDKGKRAEMGKIAAKRADIVIITDDNPRSEDPASIRKEIIGSHKKFKEIERRREAIRQGVKMLKRGDVLLIAGKGHEKTQIIGDKVIAFNDVKVAEDMIEETMERI